MMLRIVQTQRPSLALLVRSTPLVLFKRRGLVKPRQRRPHRGHPGLRHAAMTYPNSVWIADPKGPFEALDGEWYYRLTLADGFSRYRPARVELWDIRPPACNIQGVVVGNALAGAGLRPG
jgi:hypothetical protein